MQVILFDGICNFCNNSVRFIIDRDPEGTFRFASLQSRFGQELLEKHNIPKTTDSFVLVEEHHAFIESTAALKVCTRLVWPWRVLSVFLIIPKPLRDKLYRVVARNRYKWFGKQEFCMLPSENIRNRFLE
ncbi:thiol-disulfide oxidoreductase DCC family protein [Rossellomorea aquimaris]|uniref:thiol-disulfide oxidoreductase DCC family protein n=1 Tax=Rossellomorea TaxID=2837508 RepID=UPI001CD77917|nr:thiol-disulfide oxidoreductase DCC family protein [Rossellomorea aquimaris]MCA1058552.1 thiol-disulfide oxidoreductase DCC family protein [Rossellomorea aquimaris]